MSVTLDRNASPSTKLPDESIRRVVVFTAAPQQPSVVETVEACIRAFPDWQWLVVAPCPTKRRLHLGTRLRRLCREPVSYPCELAEQWWRRRPRIHPLSQPIYGFPQHCRDLSGNVTFAAFPSLSDPDCLSFLSQWRPWIGIAIAAPILQRDTFTVPTIGTLNLHKSLLPDYRGMPPGFWELRDGVPQSGATVHWVRKTLDGGPVVAQQAQSIPPFATVAGLAALLDEVGTAVLVDALKRIASGNTAGRLQGPSTSKPNRRPVWRLRKHVERRLRAQANGYRGFAAWFRGAFKTCLLCLYVHGWAPIRNVRRWLSRRQRVTVLLYHRVSDEFRDSITVGVEQFQQQLDLLRRKYDVLDLQTYLQGGAVESRRPVVVITFDDGYADNHLAARLLRRAGLPATFFISTGIVGTEHAFEHDLHMHGRRLPSLSWDQVREMAGWGYQFGNHTCDHVNLDQVSVEDGLKQVADAQETLSRNLPADSICRVLAYPFGGCNDIRAELRDRLPEIGITACLSAHGGDNPKNPTSLNICRRGIDHKFSLLAFHAAIEGWDVRNCRGNNRFQSRPAGHRMAPCPASEAMVALRNG